MSKPYSVRKHKNKLISFQFSRFDKDGIHIKQVFNKVKKMPNNRKNTL